MRENNSPSLGRRKEKQTLATINNVYCVHSHHRVDGLFTCVCTYVMYMHVYRKRWRGKRKRERGEERVRKLQTDGEDARDNSLLSVTQPEPSAFLSSVLPSLFPLLSVHGGLFTGSDVVSVTLDYFSFSLWPRPIPQSELAVSRIVAKFSDLASVTLISNFSWCSTGRIE